MMDILFLGSKAKILRCSDLITGIEYIDIVSDLSWDKAFELTNEEDFDLMVIDLASIEYEDTFFDIFSEKGDMSPLICTLSKETVDKPPIEFNHGSMDSKSPKKMPLILQDLIEEKKGIDEREELFYSSLKHDLLNKLRLMEGNLQLLKYDCDLSDMAKERLEKIEKIIDNSVELIENISTHREVVKEKPEPIDPRSSLHEVLDSKNELFVDEGFDVTVDFQERCNVIGGPLLKKVYSNIIENAVKHSGGDRIIISSERADDELLVSIEDNGKGISEEIREKLFEKGFTTGGEDGTGVGLYLVKKMMDVYGGKVDLRESELGGARFDLSLEYA